MRSSLRTIGAAALLFGAVVVAACGNGNVAKGGSSTTSTKSKGTTGAVAECPGNPIKLTSIMALSGGVDGGVGAHRTRAGADAAVAEINRTCSLGRPLEIVNCDDKDDLNTNLACGREAGSDGSLAVLTSIGSFDDGVEASKLPGVFLWGTTAFELTNPNAYSSINGLVIGMGGVSAAKAAGKSHLLLVLPDSPALQLVSQQIEQVGKKLGVKVDTLTFPQDTTDYAPVAAQVAEQHPEAIGLLPVNVVALVNALAGEGITPKNHFMSMASVVMTPEAVRELGHALDGLIVISPTVPVTDTGNAGVEQFRADMKAIGEKVDDLDFVSIVGWSNVKKLEAALLQLDPAQRASLDSKSLVDAVVGHPADRTESAPYDFSKYQLPEFPSMAAFRIFTRDIAFLKLDGGKYKLVSNGFVDMLNPPKLG